jgi:hypothetical protein
MYQVDPAKTRKAGGKPDFSDWQYDTVVQLVYDICYRRKIKRSMVVAHGTINPIDRADPQGFDWDRFKQALYSCRSGWVAPWPPSTSCWSDADVVTFGDGGLRPALDRQTVWFLTVAPHNLGPTIHLGAAYAVSVTSGWR